VPAAWVITGQHTIRVGPAYKPFYDLFSSWPAYICSEPGYYDALRSVESLAHTEAAAGQIVPPLYLLLLRPTKPKALFRSAELVEDGRSYELYKIEP
jgi:hypothetical protein